MKNRRPIRVICLLMSIICLLSFISSFAQKLRISGKILDEKNNPIAGAHVKVHGTTLNVITDVEGRFSLALDDNKKYEVEISGVGFVTKIIDDVTIDTKELQVILSANVSNLQAITVRTSSKKETVNALIQFQKNTNTVAQVVSAEAIKKSPDRNTGEVLKRVPGVSLQEGKYLIVRGLPDRYNQATLNGALMASTEPDRKTFSFDIFPSSIIDNIIINKAATPEMPGEFAGGLVQINTKDVPDKNFLEVSVGTGVNLQVLGNDFYAYKGGKYDFLGLDDGTRKLPSSFPGVTTINSASGQDNANAGKELSDIWSSKKTGTPVNASLQMNGGFNKRIGDTRAFGGIFSLNYNKQSRYSEIRRNYYDLQRLPQFDNTDRLYTTNIMTGALANFTYRSGSNKFSWKNSYNINANDQFTDRQQLDINGDVVTHLKSEELSFTSNRLLNSQLIGEHALRNSDIRIKWNGNFAQMKQDVPDLRRLKYTMDSNGDYYANISSDGNPNNAGRFNSKLSENIYGGSADIANSWDVWGNKQQVKIGALYQRKNRTFDSRGLSLIQKNGPTFSLLYLPADQILNKENYGDDKFMLDDKTVNADSYTAHSDLAAGFIQFDNQFGKRIRAVWGARIESFKQELGGYRLTTTTNEATDILPSFNITYKLTPATNIRLSGSQTVSRPEFRELSQFSFYDFARNGAVTGNSNLKRAKITNGDIRYELYPRSGELFTIGGFFKYFENPIEMQYDIGQGSPLFGFWNAKSATNYGVEVDVRKRLDILPGGFFSDLTLFGNASLIKSKIKVPDGYLGEAERPMQGQSPYVVNAGMQYDKDAWGTNVTLLFNVIGRRISQIGNQDVPQIWENSRPLLDAQVSQRLTQRASLKLSVTDILNKKGIFYWDLDSNGKYNNGKGADLPINQLKYGTNINLQFNYLF